MKAIKSLNTGTSGDIFDKQAKQFINCAELIASVSVNLFNTMFIMGCAPDCMTLGVLTPVFKRNGSNLDAKHYRGINITPIISKILESVIREGIEPLIIEGRIRCSKILQKFPL